MAAVTVAGMAGTVAGTEEGKVAEPMGRLGGTAVTVEAGGGGADGTAAVKARQSEACTQNTLST